MLLGLVFNIMSIVFSSLLNAMERFMAAQLTGFPLSVAVILAVVVFAPKLGIEAVAWGVFAASVLQVVVLIPALMGWFEYKHVGQGRCSVACLLSHFRHQDGMRGDAIMVKDTHSTGVESEEVWRK